MQQNLTNPTPEALDVELKKIKFAKLINAVMIGFLVGVSIFSFVTKGFTASGIFPLVFLFILFANRDKTLKLEKELRNRKNNTN